jgi:hypothetical protein
MKQVYAITAILFLTACGELSKKEKKEKEAKVEKIASNDTYKVLNETINDSINKCVLEIELKEKVSEKQLKKIAKELKKSRKNYEHLWISYTLAEMKVGSGAWATSHFTPKLEIKILGATAEEEKKSNSTANNIDGEIIGKWHEEQYTSSTIVIYEKNGSLFSKLIFKNGQEMIDELIAKKVKLGTKYENKDGSNSEYYIIEKDSSLGFYNKENKKYTTGIKIN